MSQKEFVIELKCVGCHHCHGFMRHLCDWDISKINSILLPELIMFLADNIKNGKFEKIDKLDPEIVSPVIARELNVAKHRNCFDENSHKIYFSRQSTFYLVMLENNTEIDLDKLSNISGIIPFKITIKRDKVKLFQYFLIQTPEAMELFKKNI